MQHLPQVVQAMRGLLVEAIVAPAFTGEARAGLQRRENLRLIALPGLGRLNPAPYEMRSIMGGFLLQARDVESWDAAKLRVISARQPGELPSTSSPMPSCWRGLARR